MKHAARAIANAHQKNVAKLFDSLCGKYSRWDIWSDFIMMSAISISNVVDQFHATERGEQYRRIQQKYSNAEMEAFAEMLSEVVMGMEQNPDQDFLGELYMGLNLSNDHAGQFFTPYCVCRMMAEMNYDIKERVEKNGWISVNDCACGAGALLVAFANECNRQHINFQTSVLFVAQDIDYIVGCMCYLQLSLMGCAGYVVIGDSIAHPATGYDRRGLLPRDEGDVWYTPMYFRDVWHYRKIAARMDLLLRKTQDSPAQAVATPAEPPKAASNQEIPPKQEAPAEPAKPLLGETKTGQLTFF